MKNFITVLPIILGVFGVWVSGPEDTHLLKFTCLFFLCAAGVWLDTIANDRTKRLLLDDNGLERNYAAALTRVLDWFDRRLVPAEMLDPDDPRYQPQRSARRGWNARAYDRCLLIALAYPLVLPFLLWIGFNLPARLGNLEVIPEADSRWPHILFGIAVGVLALNRALALWITVKWIAPRSGRVMPQKVGSASPTGPDVYPVQMPLITGAFAFCIVAAAAFDVGGAELLAVTFAYAVAIASADKGPGKGAGAFVFVSALALALMIAFLFAVADVVAGAGAVAFVGIVAFAVAGAGAVAVALNRIFERTIEHGKYNVPVYSGLTLLALATPIIFTVSLSEVPEEGRIILVFLTLFPILNALFDLPSQGITRLCLRGALGTPWRVLGFNLRPLVYSLTDLFVAIVLLGGLIVSLLISVHTLNTIAAWPFLDIDALLNAAATRSPEALWLYLMVFSTLLPTALHFAFFLVHTLAQFPGEMVRNGLAWLRPETEADGLRAGAYILGVAAWKTLITYGVWHLILWIFPSLLPLQDRIIGWTVATAQDIYLLLPY